MSYYAMGLQSHSQNNGVNSRRSRAGQWLSMRNDDMPAMVAEQQLYDEGELTPLGIITRVETGIAEVKDEMYEAACENEYQEAIDHIRHIFHVDAMAASHFADLVLHGNTTNIAPDRLEALGELIERLHE